MSPSEIAVYTDLGVRSVEKILKYFKETGGVKAPTKRRPRTGQLLCDPDIEVCPGVFACQ